ncbi:MAG: T9SS type A sorting domain-containing protein [Calditrichaeota bacterium]|nr:T9SS type A sorting domain-containing protein [Calditrichota bacterium]
MLQSQSSLQVKNSNDLSLNMQFHIPDLENEDIEISGTNYQRYFIDGEPSISSIGQPDLPSIIRYVNVPPQSGIGAVIENLSTRFLSNSTPNPVRDDLTTGASQSVVNSLNNLSDDDLIKEIWNVKSEVGADGFWPPDIVKVGKPAIMRGYRVVSVVVNPVRWNPQTNQIQIIDSLNFNLDFNSEENRINLVNNPERKQNSKYAYEIMSNLVLNPPAPPRDLEHASGSILYVTGNWNGIAEDLEPLIEWRRRMGWSVVLHQSGNTRNRDALRREILEYYESENPPEYVILVGDADRDYEIACYVHANVGNPYETDHQYACLEGDDVLADVALGRFVFLTRDMLRRQVQKTVQYESIPFIGDDGHAGWQSRAAVASTDWDNGSSANNLVLWTKDMLLLKGFDSVEQLLCSRNQQEVNPSAFINRNFTDIGISLFVYRGWQAMNGFGRGAVNAVRNGQMLPLVILATCNTGDFLEHAYDEWAYTERFMWSQAGGAIGAIGTGGATHTYYNNIFVSGAVRGMYVEDIRTQGWMMMRGKTELYKTYFDRGDILHDRTRTENWLCHTYIYNLMGDPAVDNFTDVPQQLVVDHPEQLRAGESQVSVQVLFENEDENIPAEDVLVCLYKPDEFQIKTWTDSDGFAAFHLNPEFTREGEVQVTVSGHNLMTYFVDVAIEETEHFIGASVYEYDDEEDGIANPTEELSLTIRIANLGTAVPEGELTAVLTPALPFLDVIAGEFQAEAAPEPGESIPANFEVSIGGAFEHSSQAAFNLEVSIGEDTWNSSVSFIVEGPQMEFFDLAWSENPVSPGELAELRISLSNSGTKATELLTAVLFSNTSSIEIPEELSGYEVIESEESGESTGMFTISAHPFHLAGSLAELGIALSSESGFIDTVFFSFPVGVPESDDPFGPDGYGYVCFDDLDTNWFAVPTFEWIEIDPAHEGEGVNTELEDRGNDYDLSTTVDLPFEFQYYGELFSEITICTNGWAAFGDHDDLYTACNRPIPGGLVAPAMLCPFWDDLKIVDGSGIFTYYDEENDIFVIEWSRLVRNMQGQAPTETFEIIIYDPEFHPTLTGDGDIKFQYLEIEDHRSGANPYGETPYATIGIGSADLTTGLQYIYWNELSPGASAIEPERAIKFTTLMSFETAAVHGYVTDVATGDSLENALVITDFGFWGMTDSTGYYEIPEMLVDTSFVYTFTARKEFYLDSSITGFEFNADDDVEINIAMLHPEFALDFGGINTDIEHDNANDIWVPIINSGNGTLEFNSTIEFDNPEVARDDLWDTFLELDVTNAIVGIDGEDTSRVSNRHIVGVTFIDSLFYVSGGGSERSDLYAEIYRFDRDGVFVDSIAQPWIDNWGIRGMTYDSESSTIWGAYDHHLYQFSSEFAVLDSFEVPPSRPLDVALDPSTGTKYTVDVTRLYSFDPDGNLTNDWRLSFDDDYIRMYGCAWYDDQPDSLKLLLYATYEDVPTLFGFNPVTEEIQLLSPLFADEQDRASGISVTDRWNSSVWTLNAVVSNSSADRMTVYEMEVNTTWLSYTPISGVLLAGQDTTLHIRVESGLRPFDTYSVFLRYEYNAAPGFMVIPITMTVVEESGVGDHNLVPEEFALEANWPNPFNPSTTIKYSIPHVENVKLSIYDTMGRLVDVLQNGRQNSGSHQVTFDAQNLANGVYIYRLEAGENIASRKMVLLK